jgi:hypothetical protein
MAEVIFAQIQVEQVIQGVGVGDGRFVGLCLVVLVGHHVVHKGQEKGQAH